MLSGPEWKGHEALLTPSPIEWREVEGWQEVWIAGYCVATMEKRPVALLIEPK